MAASTRCSPAPAADPRVSQPHPPPSAFDFDPVSPTETTHDHPAAFPGGQFPRICAEWSRPLTAPASRFTARVAPPPPAACGFPQPDLDKEGLAGWYQDRPPTPPRPRSSLSQGGGSLLEGWSGGEKVRYPIAWSDQGSTSDPGEEGRGSAASSLPDEASRRRASTPLLTPKRLVVRPPTPKQASTPPPEATSISQAGFDLTLSLTMSLTLMLITGQAGAESSRSPGDEFSPGGARHDNIVETYISYA